MSKGFTLIETLIVSAILLVIMIAITLFQRDVFYINSVQNGSFSTETETEEIKCGDVITFFLGP